MKSETTQKVLSIDVLVPDEENYNRHPAEQIAKLRASLNAFGQVKPIVVQPLPKEGKGATKYRIAAGHGLVEAATLEGWEEVKAEVLPADWPPEKVRAYLVADNETARQSDRDDVQLASLLEEIGAFDESLLMPAGFTAAEMDALLNEVGAGDEKVATREMDTRPPPKMAWVLVGMPLTGYGRIASLVEQIADDPESIVETTTSDE